ncbi:MAG: hypothetical protein HUU38_08205 [Anaerolineales bacterium]|nr:hypothetical protein [Anaerolineales bacterium]
MSINTEFAFTPLENGLDFILRALEYLGNNPTKRDLKYAVLHLHSGIELILKERLRREHWSLVFEKPEEADEEKYIAGDFFSVRWKTCLKRLEIYLENEITNDQLTRLEELKNKRNRIEHFGIVDSEQAIKSVAVFVIEFAIDFISNELGQMDEQENELMKEIQKNLSLFQDFVINRMKNVEFELRSYGVNVLTCPRCIQDTLCIEKGAKCLFCGYQQYEIDSAIEEYVNVIFGIDWHTIAEGGEWPQFRCPACEMDALLDLSHLGNIHSPDFICFDCGEAWDGRTLEFCSNCGQPKYRDDLAVCEECFRWVVNKDE